MSKIMILGANGAMARLVTEKLLNETDHQLVLFLRNADRLSQYKNNNRVQLVDGDIYDTPILLGAMKNVDIVYSNLGGVDLDEQINQVLSCMKKLNIKRFIYISSLGAHHEVPGKYGEWNEGAIKDYLPGFRRSADLVEKSGLEYTEIRPAWLTNNDEVDYETTQVDEPFRGTEVSRKSVAEFVFTSLNQPNLYVNKSIGLNKPNTDGDKPSWM